MKLRAALVACAGLAFAVAFCAAAQSTHAQVAPSLFSATPLPSVSMLPACGKGLVSSAGPSYYDYRVDDGVHVTVALALPTGGPCTLSGFPAIAFAGHVSGSPLPLGRLSTASSVVLDPQTRASFTLRYVIVPKAPSNDCTLAVLIAGTPAQGKPPVTFGPLGVDAVTGRPSLPGCQAASEIDVSSFSPFTGNVPPPSPSPPSALPKHVRRCDVADLGVRDVGATPLGASAQRVTVAVQNRSLTPCALPRDMRVALLGAQGRLMNAPVTLHESPAAYPRYGATARGELALRAGHEASVLLDLVTRDSEGNSCPQSSALALVFPDGRFTASAPATLAPCPGKKGDAVIQTPLLSGVPLYPADEPNPAPAF